MQDKYICIHGHFYQPPRENPWLDLVEQQESANPYHDWNERINFECYAPNAVARILNSDQKITQIRNNYKRISFNFGPTLLSWMEEKDPATYALLKEADERSIELYGGHGNALAQVHSHLILPLCNYRDKVTQVQWGIRDFERRFDRYPEGIWLAETAVDVESLEVLASHGIRYTILAPRQAKAFRIEGEENWTEVNENTLDKRRPYWCNLPSGRRIALFFYDGHVAKDVAFNGLLNSGSAFKNRLTQCFSENDTPQLVHIATDGESYGHHHRHGEMALAACLWSIENEGDYKLTNYGQYLELFPPTHEVKIWENSSWSCAHGVERWRSNCGCNAGTPGWTQTWRSPLRQILDELRDRLIPAFEKEAGRFLRDPWAARNSYIDVINDRTEAAQTAFLEKHQKRKLSPKEAVYVFRLLEMQKHALYMFTSCAWFFDEVSGIETNQVLQYALRAMEYAKDSLNLDFLPEFTKALERTSSNVYENAADSFKRFVLPARVDLKRVAMHYAVQTVISGDLTDTDVFNYQVSPSKFSFDKSGTYRLATGILEIDSLVTHAHKRYSFAVVHLGAHHIIGNLSETLSEGEFEKMQKEAIEAFKTGRLASIFGVLQPYFGPEKFTIDSLFREEKTKILNQFAQKKLGKAYRDMVVSYRECYPLMVALEEAVLPIPEGFLSMANMVLKHRIREFYDSKNMDLTVLEQLVGDLKKWKLKIKDELAIEHAAEEGFFQMVSSLDLYDVSQIDAIEATAKIIKYSSEIEGLELALWKTQNEFYRLSRSYRKVLVEYENDALKRAVEMLEGVLLIKN